MDLSFIANPVGVKLPDPVAEYGRALTLADLASRNRVDKIKEEELTRGLEAQRSYEDALPGLVQSNFSTDAVVSAVTANPRAAGAILKETDARRKAALDQEKTGADIGKTRADTRKIDLALTGGMAQTILSNPQSGPRDLETLESVMKRVGLDPSMFGDRRQDPEGWLRKAAGASIEASKQLELQGQAETRRETGRHNMATEGNQAATLAETTRYHTGTLNQQGAMLNETRRHHGATEGIGREANTVARGGNVQKAVIELRKEFQQLPEVQSYKTVIPILNSVRNAPDTTAGDLDLIYGVGKILDPTSVVRESEQVLVIKSGSPLERALGQMGYVVGRGRLTPEMRTKVVAMLQGRVGELENQYKAARATYERAADENGLPKDQIFVDFPSTKPPAAGGAPISGGKLKQDADGTFRYGYP